MGSEQSVFTEDELQLYQNLTGLNNAEILHAYKRFREIDPLAFNEMKKGWISSVSVAENLPELKENPFKYRICKVFTSDEAGFMDFDDFIHLVSVMSDKAPVHEKLTWAFELYDFNEDGMLCRQDLNAMLDSLTGSKISQESKDDFIDHILHEADQDNDGEISFQEFERIMTVDSAAPEFLKTFRFQL